MGRTTGRAGWVAIVATAITLVTPLAAAHADFGDTIDGGCGFVTDQDATLTSGLNEGVIYDLSLTQEQNSAPSDATVSCWIDVNGVEQAGTRLTVSDVPGTGIEAGQQPISFAAASGAQISLCQQVTFADGSTWAGPRSGTSTECTPVIDGTFDAITCALLVRLGEAVEGAIFGTVLIRPDGDVYVHNLTGTGTTWIYDCPAYGNGVGTPLVPNPAPTVSFIKLLLPEPLR